MIGGWEQLSLLSEVTVQLGGKPVICTHICEHQNLSLFPIRWNPTWVLRIRTLWRGGWQHSMDRSCVHSSQFCIYGFRSESTDIKLNSLLETLAPLLTSSTEISHLLDFPSTMWARTCLSLDGCPILGSFDSGVSRAGKHFTNLQVIEWGEENHDLL